MPRKARIDAAGALHHIIVRGIERRKIFYDNTDRDAFVNRLGQVLIETHTDCFAWALIPNHVHLLLRTGLTPIATVMRRLLTGYAVQFNRRHRRHGHVFKNRYKSILCQEDPYLKELVRYIHLNPLRAGLVADYKSLKGFVYGGHCALAGKCQNAWQNTQYILSLFGQKVSEARRLYIKFVEKGVSAGKRPELVGGGLIRSLGGWSAVKALRGAKDRIKGDERILGNGNFVQEVLEGCRQQFERRYLYQAKGYDFDWLVDQVATLFGLEQDVVTRAGRSPDTVEARSVPCYWAARELGQHLGAVQKAWHFATHGQSIGKTGRKDREREGTQDDGMTYVNISIPVPKLPKAERRKELILGEVSVNIFAVADFDNQNQ
ncbi:MAG: transposase [Pseudomonadota bacterium]